MFGIQVVYKSGENDWVSPCENEPKEVDGCLIVSGQRYNYSYDLKKLERWLKYALCDICEHDVRTYGCATNKCENHRCQWGGS